MSVLSVTKAILPVLLLLVFALWLVPSSAIVRVAKASKSKGILVVGYVAVLCGLLFVSTFVPPTLFAYGLIPRLPRWWGHLMLGIGFMSVLLIALTPVLYYMKIRKKRK